MRALEGWTIDRYGGPELTRIVDPEGTVAATVTPGGRAWAPLWKVVGLEGKLRQYESEAWASRGGNVPIHGRAVVTLADGTEVRLRHGAPHGPRRRAQDVRVAVAGRRYGFAHRSAGTAEVRRDGEVIVHATASGERGRPDDAVPAAFTRGVDLAVRAPLDRTDEVVVVLLTELCGPPGRAGAVRRFAGALWDMAKNP
ncbi:hypothetical protein [Actinomarinicola tropica]|uniref:Uncharacterized protein n=1 Tax=Actinomarinicola tropica TaxID=2789776 RepID=A0A5Q2RFI8_9ACTN|nr:hypothetical protein [Actinomarinicola tropica]QGG94404.1 hypothetical protein GH723_04400 [Actinomarinicola tropica]